MKFPWTYAPHGVKGDKKKNAFLHDFTAEQLYLPYVCLVFLQILGQICHERLISVATLSIPKGGPSDVLNSYFVSLLHLTILYFFTY